MPASFQNVNAGRDVIGRDKITNLPTPTQMDRLNELYKEELSAQDEHHNLIDELHHYNTHSQGTRTLREKLIAAGFDNIINEAEELKELISKIIIKNQNYKSAQKIITLILSETQSIFNANIKPALVDIDDESKLAVILREELEQVIQGQLGENVLEIFNRQIKGMMYFLTGNCHIEWE